jgi:RNA polymerase sigma-70 factor (sigma-E family)
VTESAGVPFDAFVAARTPALVRTAYLLTGDWQRAEDLLQTALMRCYGRWERIREPDAYVRRALVLTYAGWRRRRWSGEHPSAVPDQPVEHDATAAVDARADLVRLLATLPARQRAVVVLRFYEDLSESEVAALLGVSVGTVKSQASKALARLRPLARAEERLP